ncbi:MAG: hypothetical protein HOI95_14090 [Chromatiales bacterium]|jgi:peptide/nickel transport system permease protein|nr:hypothetical protein [Chromatiales bacterium]
MSQFSRFVVMRFLLAIVTLLIVTFIVSSLVELSPVQVFDRCWESQKVPRDGHYVIRWVNWVLDIFLHGDFGFACIARQLITELLGVRFWISQGICLSSLLLAYFIAIPVGIYSVVSPNLRFNHTTAFLLLPGSFDSEFPGRNSCSSDVVKSIWGNAHG